MKEYDQFMRQVKGRGKSMAPNEGFANEFGSTASMKASLGYDPQVKATSVPKRKMDGVESYMASMRASEPQVRQMMETQAEAQSQASRMRTENELYQKYANMGFSLPEIRGMIADYFRKQREQARSGAV
jgi:hypothetical protein